MFYALASRPEHRVQRSHNPVAGRHALDRFLHDAVNPQIDAGTTASRTAAIEDLDTNYKLTLDVPGLAKEHLDIGIEGDVVRVTSKEDTPRKVKAAWRFPLEIDVASSSARLENGVLSLTLGKKVPVSNVAQLVIS